MKKLGAGSLAFILFCTGWGVVRVALMKWGWTGLFPSVLMTFSLFGAMLWYFKVGYTELYDAVRFFPMNLHQYLQYKVANRRPPDFIVGAGERPYLQRWWIIPRNRCFGLYLHKFCRSDDDRALHDHRYWNLSILLDGSYVECTIAQGGVHKKTFRHAGTWSGFKFRSPWTAHRVMLLYGKDGNEKAVWTLFITGPVVRDWGFHCPKGWVPWQKFTAAGAPGEVGRGCEE